MRVAGGVGWEGGGAYRTATGMTQEETPIGLVIYGGEWVTGGVRREGLQSVGSGGVAGTAGTVCLL